MKNEKKPVGSSREKRIRAALLKMKGRKSAVSGAKLVQALNSSLQKG